MSHFQSLNHIFLEVKVKYGQTPLFYSKDAKKDYHGLKFKDAYHMAENLALSLMELGLSPKDKIGLMSDNRVEWSIADMATQFNGAVNVPRGSDSTPSEIQYILEHSESKFCFVEHEKLLDSLLPIQSKTKVQNFIVLDRNYKPKDPKVLSIVELIEKGEALRSSKLQALEDRASQVEKDDLFTIIYTSGTTGLPKGVMLTHQNMIYNVEKVPPMIGLRDGDRLLSILPVWHIFERAIVYSAMATGSALYYTNIRDIRDDFQKAKPTFMASAPRLWENLYQGIKAKLDKTEDSKKNLFDIAYEVCKTWRLSADYLTGNKLIQNPEDAFSKLRETGLSLFGAVNLFLPAKVLDALVFSKLRDVLGGELRGTISGGGALPSHVDEFFNVIGIPVYEGYGMTECAPIISVRSVGKVVMGTVGTPPEGTFVEIRDDKGQPVPQGKMGIIHIKGPQVMKGYYKNEEATEKAVQDGWMNTGDLGFFSTTGTLSVRGRVKDTIVLLGGENVEPVPIENLLLEHPLIDQVIVVGQDQKSLTALIWPNFTHLEDVGFAHVKPETLNSNKDLRNLMNSTIKGQVSTENGFKSFEKVTDFRFLPKAMEVGDELTNLFKMKRNVIADKYASLIKEMYS